MHTPKIGNNEAHIPERELTAVMKGKLNKVSKDLDATFSLSAYILGPQNLLC